MRHAKEAPQQRRASRGADALGRGYVRAAGGVGPPQRRRPIDVHHGRLGFI